MKCRVLLFAQLAEAAGRREIEIDLPEGATVGDALAVLGREHEAIDVIRDRIAVAVNEKYGALRDTLHDGDTIALIPPVSGG